MPKWDTGGARHVLMRAGLAFVMSWFGIQELRNPSDWAVFVPSFIADHSPVAVNDLILLHGFLLLLGAASVGLGLLYVVGCVLATGLLAEILFGLWYNEGINDLVIRDVGLLALAGGLALDPVRFWHLENVLPQLFTPSNRATRRRAARAGKAPSAAAPVWLVQASGAGALVALVLAVSVLLNATGSSGSGLPDSSVTSLASSSQPSPAPTPAAGATPAPNPAAANPTPAATTIKFNDWQYKSKSYQIYPGDPSSDAQNAMSGFQLSVQDQGSKVLLTLKALSSRYQDASETIDKGDTVYFVETSMRDDPSGRENELNDDGVVIVNPDGYILQQ